MNISKLNPLGYETTTDKGNKYKATNAFMYSMGVGSLAFSTAPLLVKKPLSARIFLRSLSEAQIIKDEILRFSKLKFSKGQEKVLFGACIAFDFLLNLAFGRIFDNWINKSRAKKADKKAEILNTKV